MTKKAPAPEHLSPRARQLWAELVPSRADTAERQVLLCTALEDLDRIDEMRELLKREGVLIVSARSRLPHTHPALKLEAEARRRFLAAWRALNLTHQDSFF